jgi:hypothetical protein
MRGKMIRSAAVAFAACAAAVAGIAYAAIPGSSGAITACASPSGVLRVIDVEAGDECVGRQTTLSWSAQQSVSAAHEKFGSVGPIGCCLRTVVALTLPAGNYVLQAKGQAQNRHPTRPTSLQCLIRANGEHLDSNVVGLDRWENFPTGPTSSFGFTQSIANLSTANLPEGGTVALVCSDNGSGDVFVQDAHLVATSVGSVARSQS